MVGYLKHEATHGLRFNKPKDLAIVGMVDSVSLCNEQGYSEEYFWLLSYCGRLSCELDVESTAKCYTEQGVCRCEYELACDGLQALRHVSRMEVATEAKARQFDLLAATRSVCQK